ncbi:MAG: alanine--glyoxylate aminotransferase family protein [Thermoguttaceae bacterium]|jgi:aspartate aminotransferase-like enzyme
MKKQRLMTPGPTQVPDEARLALARQIIHHRTPEFRGLLVEVLAGLQYVLATQNDVVLLSCSGTGGMEAAVVNLVPRGGKAIVLESGKFAQRWREIAERFGIEVVRLEVPWGEPFAAADVARLLAEHPDAAAVYATLQETSTGVGHDIEAIGRVVAASRALFVVDGISGVGVMECRTDAWGIDVLVVGAQKALMTQPGLAFLAVSPAAWKQIEAIPRPAFYFDLLAYRKGLAGAETPFTPATALIVALAESLRMIRQQGIEAVWARGKLLAQAAREGLAALGLKLVAARPAAGLTAAYLPDGVDGRAFLDRLEERFGVKLAGGQGPLKGRIFRLAHMGMLDELEILSALAAIELVLVEMGQNIKLGVSVGAASRVLAQVNNHSLREPKPCQESSFWTNCRKTV